MEDDDDRLGPNNPYNGMAKMEGPQDSIRPDFEGEGLDKNGLDEGDLGKAKKRRAPETVLAAEKSAGLWAGGSGSAVMNGVDAVRRFYKGSGDKKGEKGRMKGKMKKYSAVFLFFTMFFAIPLLLMFLSTSVIVARQLDIGLQEASRSAETDRVVERQSMYISQEMLSNGRMPEAFSNDLAMHGIEVGQVTLAGDFVRTNLYLADLDGKDNEVASNDGGYLMNGDKGELSIRFKDHIIRGSEFVAAVDSDPELYGKYSDAFNTTTRLRYSQDFNDAYAAAEISRGNFNTWVPTGDKEVDQENFNEMFANAIDNNSMTYVNGYNGNSEGEDSSASVSTPSDSVFSEVELAAKVNTNTNNRRNNNGTNSYELLEGYGNLTFYGPDAASNGGYAGRNGTETINGGALADGQVARDTRDGGILAFGDVIYIETSNDPGAEGSYANGKYFIVADTGGETAHSSKWDIDVFVDEPNPSALNGAPYGSIPDAKIYKVASGVSWEEFLSTYYGKSGGVVGKKSCKKGSVTESDEGFTVCIGCDNPETIIDRVGSRTIGDNSTNKAAQLINIALSSVVPFKAGRVATAVQEVLQQTVILGDNSSDKITLKNNPYALVSDLASIGDDQPQRVVYNASAPIDQLMYLLALRQKVTYNDATTHEEITKDESVLENGNFTAAISNGELNVQEAQNFQLDGPLYASRTADTDVIRNTTSAARGSSRSNSVLKIGDGDAANLDQLSGASSNLQFAFSQQPSEMFAGTAGANWIIQGASWINNYLTQKVLGALASDAQTIEAYRREIDELLEKKAIADRATRSPFDISSKNTFLGSIIHNLASSAIIDYKGGTNDASTWSVLKTVSALVDKSTENFVGTVVADGPRKNFASTLGSNCFTVNSAFVEGDFYCTQYTTLVTSYMDKVKDWWNSAIDESILEDFVAMWVSRESTLGIKDARVCEYWKDKYQGVFDKIFDAMSNMVGLYNSCRGVDENDSIGVNFTNGIKNTDVDATKLYAAYVLYDKVYSVMNDSKSHVAEIRENYYKKYPLDQSPEGRLARISGLSKEEAAIAMNYASYLNMIANYNPATRYAFGDDLVDVPNVVEFIDDEQVETSVYLAWFSKIEYSDVRNRSFVV